MFMQLDHVSYLHGSLTTLCLQFIHRSLSVKMKCAWYSYVFLVCSFCFSSSLHSYANITKSLNDNFQFNYLVSYAQSDIEQSS